VLLADRSAEVHGGTGLHCVHLGLHGEPLGQSSDLCCKSASCPKPPPPPPKPRGPVTDRFFFGPKPPPPTTHFCLPKKR
jgi:hypothetical protein